MENTYELLCHPAARYEHVSAVCVGICQSSTELRLRFRLEGDLQRIRLNPLGEPLQLWQHTCFEAFIGIVGNEPYLEFNFAPSGEWRVHNFLAYRDREPEDSGQQLPSPLIAVRTTDRQVELDVRLVLAVSTIDSRATLRLGVAAIVEADDGSLSYWALRHSSEKPDFHCANDWVLRLQPPSSLKTP